MMTVTTMQAIYQRTETALVMGAKLSDVYAIAIAIEDVANSLWGREEVKADESAQTVRPGAK